jgi:Phosphatidylinositol-4-phosphate 5-Kinase
MDEQLPSSPTEPPRDNADVVDNDDDDEQVDRPIATWTYCQNCEKVVTPIVYISENTWKWSFGKFLEVFFYNRDAVLNAPGYRCSCQLQSAATLYYGCGNLAARFTYESLTPFGVFVRRCLPIDLDYHKKTALTHLSVISAASSELFVKFDKHIEKVSREARYLFNSAMNRPEHLQTVLSELNRIGSDVDHAAKTLQEKIASVAESCRRQDDVTINGALLRFPWFARRYLFNLTSAWNEKLRYAGQAISAMKKIAASASRIEAVGLGPNVSANVSDPYNEELAEGMKRLRQLMDHYANVNVTDITQVLPTFPGSGGVINEAEFDDDFDDPDSTIDFSDGIDADVLASRRRLLSKGSNTPTEKGKGVDYRPSKALGTRRSLTDQPRLSHGINQEPEILDQSNLNSSAPPKPTPGGAVKSAITRFFNRGGRDYEQYVVHLGIFFEGRPRLLPGINGIVVPVRDDQLSTIIAHSLASVEYSKQFKQFSRTDGMELEPENSLIERNRKVKPDLDAGIESNEARNRSFDGLSQDIQPPTSPSSQANRTAAKTYSDDFRDNERHMIGRNKSHIKHTFRDIDEKGFVTCKFVCTTFWATQFHAVRQVFLSPNAQAGNTAFGKPDGDQIEGFLQSGQDIELSYIESLSSAEAWATSGGKSGASFARTSDDRFVIKCISRTELQMFLDCAPAYFEYLTKAFFHGL